MLDNYLLGKDPRDIERHWQALYRGRYFRGGPVLMSAIAGIDQALWDLKGKAHGVPVYELLGGRARDRILAYQWIEGDTPEQIATAAEQAVDDGYRALKLSAVSSVRRIDHPSVVREAREDVAAFRDAVGDEIDLIVDFRGRVTKAMAPRMAAELDEFGPMFIEEPVLAEQWDVFREVKQHSTTPLASGERLYSRWDFEGLLSDGSVDVIQPNPSHAGGITETRKIANVAETRDISAAFHCPLGPIALASCVHLDLAVPNAIVQGQDLDVHAPEGNPMLSYLSDPNAFRFEDGYIHPPEGPGLGLDIDESTVRNREAPQLDWENPIWYNDDGSITEW
jgi:galactonate dehydratase